MSELPPELEAMVHPLALDLMAAIGRGSTPAQMARAALTAIAPHIDALLDAARIAENEACEAKALSAAGDYNEGSKDGRWLIATTIAQAIAAHRETNDEGTSRG